MATKSKLKYPIVQNMPVARFYYKGHHSHPVRRTVIVTEMTPKFIRGYEIREGSITRTLNIAPIKSFSRDRIAQVKSIRSETRKNFKPTLASTAQPIVRADLLNILTDGF